MKSLICLFAIAFLGGLPQLAYTQESNEEWTTDDLWKYSKLGDATTVEKILDSGIAVDSKTPYGATALIFAAERGHEEVAKLLLDKGADVNAKDDFYGISVYTWAIMGRHKELGDLLKERGGKPAMAEGTAGSTKKTAETTTIDPEVAATNVDSGLEDADQMFSSSNWPQFRGIGSRGLSDGLQVPQKWSVEAGENVLWKTPIPGLGHSCPVVWDDLIFVTTAVSNDSDMSMKIGNYGDYKSIPEHADHEFLLIAVDKLTGEIRWQKTAHTALPQVKRHLKSTHANPTCATNGKQVVAFFGSEGLYCYDFAGELIWKKDLGFLDSGWFYDAEYQWGFASSPVIHGEFVFVQCDIQKNSFLAAFRLSDGEEVWRTSRDELPTWSTPTVCDTSAGPVIVTNGTNRVRGYDAVNGEQLWELGGNSEIAVPTPQFAYQTIFVTSGYRPIQPIYAISPDARGDISLKDDAQTNESIKWSLPRNGPYLPTPVVYRGFLYTLDNSGVVTCYEAMSGKQVYRERIKGFGSLSFVASPVAADGHIFATAEDGQVIVIKAGPKFETLHSNPTGESVLATPAMSKGMFLIRSQSHLIATGKKEIDSAIQH